MHSRYTVMLLDVSSVSETVNFSDVSNSACSKKARIKPTELCYFDVNKQLPLHLTSKEDYEMHKQAMTCQHKANALHIEMSKPWLTFHVRNIH